MVQLIRIECAWKGTPPPFAKMDGNYDHRLVGPPRTGIKPLDIVQPEGPSFMVCAPDIDMPTCLLSRPWAPRSICA